jgi:hypothetical protein
VYTGNSRRDFLKKLAVVSVVGPEANRLIQSSDRKEKITSDIGKFKKIDVHMHISSDASYLREVMDELELKMFIMTNKALQLDRLKLQVEVAIDISSKYPRYYAWCTTFGFEKMFEPGWHDRVKKFLKYGFDNGALAVKVWKEVGMQVKNPDGGFIQVDDPVFDPIFEYIKQEGKPLFTHIGDPVDNWLSMGPDGKQNYWYTEGADITKNRIGEFRGQVSYDKLMLARDRMLSKHPDLKVIGCHLGCMAFDLDEVAHRLDKYPNFAVDTSLTVPYLMGQAREKVRSFFIKYQDRIIYGLDESGGMVPTQYLKDMSKVGQSWTKEEVEKEKKKLLKRYNDDFTYYFTDHEIKKGDYTIRGLALPEEVLKKVFYSNAVKWVPGIDKSFQ